MFAYCGNNPVISTDSTGMRTDIWPVLFGDHNQGYIHRMVQLHIVASGVILYYVKEQKDQKRTVDCVYPERILLQKNDAKEVLVAIGLGFALSFAGVNNGIADPVATIAYAY